MHSQRRGNQVHFTFVTFRHVDIALGHIDVVIKCWEMASLGQNTSTSVSCATDGPMPPSESELDQRRCRYTASPRDAMVSMHVTSAETDRTKTRGIRQARLLVFGVWPSWSQPAVAMRAIWTCAFYKSSHRSRGQFAMKTSFAFPMARTPDGSHGSTNHYSPDPYCM